MSTLAADARALMEITTDVAGERISEARQRLTAALGSGHEIHRRIRDKAVEGSKTVDLGVRANPFQAIGIAFGIGALIGYFIIRRSSDNEG
jgi:ElaB/YqjD/DUF883 family membrane-anchored ribosome-binding protein